MIFSPKIRFALFFIHAIVTRSPKKKHWPVGQQAIGIWLRPKYFSFLFLVLTLSPLKAEDISLNAYDALQGMFLQIGASAYIHDLKLDKNTTSQNTEKIEKIEDDIEEIKGILRFLAGEMAQKQEESQEEKELFLLQNKDRIEEIKQNAKILRKSMYETKNTLAQPQTESIQQDGFKLEKFEPTTYMILQETKLFSTPYTFDSNLTWPSGKRFTSYSKHGSRLKVSGEIMDGNWKSVDIPCFIDENKVSVYRQTKTFNPETQNLPDYFTDTTKLQSSIFKLNQEASVYESATAAKPIDNWPAEKMITANIQEKGWIRISGEFVNGYWKEFTRERWIQALYLDKIR